jgi:hypothetical protein
MRLLLVALIGCSSKEPSTSAPTDTGVVVADTGPRTVRIYMAGESIERRNHYVEAPLRADGALNDRGGGELRNDQDEYGWLVPLADRLKLRVPSLTVSWVGTEAWVDADDAPYSGTYPSTTPSPSSSISGTTIDQWLDARRSELTGKTHCYDLAIASRGGNDYVIEDDAAIKTSLKELLRLLANGSSCNSNPPIYVTAHMPDDQRTTPGEPTDAAYVAQQKQRYITRFRDAVNELKTERPTLRLRFVDLFTPFVDNKKTTAFPAEVWSTGGVPDYAKINRSDLIHIRRLSSIYIGELFADAIDLADL